MQAERGRKAAESERDEATSRVSEINIHITALTNEKRRLEGDNTGMMADMEECRASLVSSTMLLFLAQILSIVYDQISYIPSSSYNTIIAVDNDGISSGHCQDIFQH